MNYISSDLANKYYKNILDFHRMDTEFYFKVTDIEMVLEEMIANIPDPELADAKTNIKKQQQWIRKHKIVRVKKTGFIPEDIAGGLLAIYAYRNKGKHEKVMNKAAYLGNFKVMARAISFFSNTPIPQEIKAVCDGNDSAEANKSEAELSAQLEEARKREAELLAQLAEAKGQNGKKDQPPPLNSGQPLFNSIEGLKGYLSNKPRNPPGAPYAVKLDVADITGLNGILRNAARYVSLDLSGSTITAIPKMAFSPNNKGNTFLTGITIPDSVDSIWEKAFTGCTSLKNVTIGNSVTGIGDSAFSGCTSLASITIPDSVTFIGDEAFAECASLKSVTIPDSVTSVRTPLLSSTLWYSLLL